MVRFIIVTFGFMGLGFYELSGGSEFEPADWRTVSVPEVTTDPLPQSVEVAAPEITDVALEDKPQVQQTARTRIQKTDSLVVFASVPTTRRLVGDSTPTPKAQKASLGPDPTLSRKTEQDKDIPAYLTAEIETAPDFRFVTGSRVNMRNGPGTQYSVVGRLLRDDEVEVLQDPGFGWVKLQVLETGRIGWMSSKLLRKLDS